MLLTVVGVVPEDFEILGRTSDVGDAAVHQPAAARARARTCCRRSAA